MSLEESIDCRRSHLISRRRLISAAAGGAGIALLSRRGVSGAHAFTDATPTIGTGGDPEFRGVELLRAWVAGLLPKAPVPVGWLAYVPVLGAGFFYPKDWIVTDVVDPNRADLTDGDPFGAWVVAPDQSAAVLMLNLNSLNPVTVEEAAWIQLQQLVPGVTPVKIAEDSYVDPTTVTRTIVAARADQAIIAVIASAMPSVYPGGMFLYFNAVIGVAEIFDAATEQVFLPLLQNLVTGGPGNGGDDDAGGGDDSGDDDDV